MMSLSSSLSAPASSAFASQHATGMTAPAPADEATRESVSPTQSGRKGKEGAAGEGGPQPSDTAGSTSAASTAGSARRVMFPSDLLERAFATEALRMQHQQQQNKSSLVQQGHQLRRATATMSLSTSRTSGISQLCKGPMAEWAKLFDDDDDDVYDHSSLDNDTLSETSTCTEEEEEEEDASGSDSEEETAMVQALVRAAFEASAASATAAKCTSAQGNRESKSSLINRLIGTSDNSSNDSTAAVHRRGLSSASSDRTFPVRKKQRLMSLTTHSVSTTEAENQEMLSQQSQRPIAMRFTASAPSLLKPIDSMSSTDKNDPLGQTKPDDYLRELLLPQDNQQQENDASNGSSLKTPQYRLKYYKASELSDFFVPLTPQAIAGYDTALVQAVRRQDVAQLHAWHAQGRCLHAGNPYGETILHAAARRGATDVVRLLLHECHVPVRVCCDYQRTVLHDACWTVTPHWDCIELLLDACPDLLFVQDRRGSTPLQYVPKEHWGDWCRYLKQRHQQPCHGVNKSKLEPRELQVIVPVQDE